MFKAIDSIWEREENIYAVRTGEEGEIEFLIYSGRNWEWKSSYLYKPVFE